MIRLAAKLGAEREKQNPVTQVNPILAHPDRNSAEATNGHMQDFVRDGREKLSKPVALPPVDMPEGSITGRQKRKKNRKKSKVSKEVEERRFHTKNIFENLRDMRIDPEEARDSASPESEPAMDFEDAEARSEEPVVEVGSWQNEIYVQDKTGWVPIEQSERRAMEIMPNFDNEFWAEFGNTLRVFGTEEKVLKIADW
jgi:poly(A)-specific ribonuclease